MTPGPRTLLCLITALYSAVSWSSDACSERAITAVADVEVSDGSTFSTESYFRSRNTAAIRHRTEHEQLVVVEGPLAWVQQDDQTQLGAPFHKAFALGHQYHALLLYFAEIVDDVRRTEQLEFGGNVHAARTGSYPYGGTVHLIEGDKPERPAGFLFEFPESPPIETSFSDWRSTGGIDLPYHARIDDGANVFDYRYSAIDLSPQSPGWFSNVVGTPEIDELKIYRLHRDQLAAHCMGDAAMMAALSAPEITSANRGELRTISNAAMRTRFESLFESLNYTEYHDIAEPVIRVAESGDIGWVAVNVRAIGLEKETNKPFDGQWAWLMAVEKIDGQWRHAGNASNNSLE